MKWFDRYLQKVRVKKVIPFVKDADQILDIGSGDGALFKNLEKRKIQFSGIGLDPGITEQIDNDLFRIIKARFPSPEVNNCQFDVLTAMAVLEHIPVALLDEFVHSCNNQLKSDGLIIITVPSPRVDQILKLLIKLRVIDGMEVEEHYGYDTKMTVPLFCSKGFELKEHRRFQFGLNNLFVFRKISRPA